MKNILSLSLAVVFAMGLDIPSGRSQEDNLVVEGMIGSVSSNSKRNCASCHQGANDSESIVGDICPAMVHHSASQLATLSYLINDAQASRDAAAAVQSRAGDWIRKSQDQLSWAAKARSTASENPDQENANSKERYSISLAELEAAQNRHARALDVFQEAQAKEQQYKVYLTALQDALGNEALQSFALKALAQESARTADAQETASPYWIGVQCEPASEVLVRMEQHNGNLLIVKGGLKVNAVTVDSPAQAAGVQELDVILFMNDKPTNQIEELVAIIGENEEKPATLSVVRDHNALSLSVTPAKRPQANTAEGLYHLDLKLLHDANPSLLVRNYYGFLQPAPELPEGFEAQLRFVHGAKPVLTIQQQDRTWTVNDETLPQVPKAVQPFAQSVWQGIPQAEYEPATNKLNTNDRVTHLDLVPEFNVQRGLLQIQSVPVLSNLYTARAAVPIDDINAKLDQLQQQIKELRELVEGLKK